ncbi:MAG: UPF0280 family protein [Spirochaetia bacterium]|nr:UPF0280 family protein [Spirochaetia bacterium]
MYRVHSTHFTAVSREIRRLWNELEQFISLYPQFSHALQPLSVIPGTPPESARRMIEASQAADVGPMAAVAGTFAQLAAQAGQESGDRETIIENGGDVYLYIQQPLSLGLWIGPESPFRQLAFMIEPADSPLAVCSSSSILGHSMSFGRCDLFTVFSKDASLADAAATAFCNRVHTHYDLQSAVETAVGISKIEGAVAIKGEKLAMAGNTPQLIRHADPDLRRKITRHDRSEKT